MTIKDITRVNRGAGGHWVGNGFPVRTLFSYQDHADEISPFLLLDYAGPAEFDPSDKPRGVEMHPHRGFETVTIVYQGEVEHKDTAGHAGKIGPGDVQWMTAARGVLHEEMHGREFTRTGGTLEMVQLWVNLPSALKMSDPRYQEILNGDIPVVDLPDGAGVIRLIAGNYAGMKGAASTFTPVNILDIRIRQGGHLNIPDLSGFNASLLVLDGEVAVHDGETLGHSDIAMFNRDGDMISVFAKEDAKILLLAGAPIEEPVAGYGPFVMNTQGEIRQALADYRAGRF